VYHINAVDEVTQWEIVAATPHISEAYLEPVLREVLEQFPFRLLGFHSDNGSEYINTTVARLLNKLLIQQTKSRPRHSNDNGLVETKNAAVIRKHIGYGYIDARQAEQLQQFYRNFLNPYLNFHRPCAQPELYRDEKVRTRRRYFLGKRKTRVSHIPTALLLLFFLSNPTQKGASSAIFSAASLQAHLPIRKDFADRSAGAPPHKNLTADDADLAEER